MSLHIGRLSPYARLEDLERAFQRFGRCQVRLKEGYGFAVYEERADAERALRNLQGRTVCGENISLNWSNKQPRPFQRPTSGPRNYDGRNLRERRTDNRFRGFHDRKDFQSKESGTDDMRDPSVKDTEREGEKSIAGKQNVSSNSEECRKEAQSDPWIASSNGEESNSFGKHGKVHNVYDEADGNKKSHRISSDQACGENPLEMEEQRYASESKQIEHSSELARIPQTLVGRGKYSEDLNFKEKQELRLKRFGSSSWRMQGGSRSSESQQPIREDQGSPERTKRTSRTSDASSEDRKYDMRRSSRAVSDNSQGGNSGDDVLASKEVRMSRNSRKPDRALAQSESAPKRSLAIRSSPDSGSASSPLSRSRIRFRTNSRFRSRSRSRSHSRSPFPLRSRSRTRSRLDLPGSSSPLASFQSVRSKSNARSDLKSRSSSPMSLSVCVSPKQKTTDIPENDQSADHTTCPLDENEENAATARHGFKDKTTENGPTADDELEIASCKKGDPTGEKHPQCDCDLPDLESKPEDNERHQEGMSGIGNQISHPQNSSSSNTKHNISCGKENSIKLMANEVLNVLRYYGMEVPDRSSLDASVEEIFGAARMWPWELIYYRRLKKGGITIENYARRLEQNQEYGITDKYIRSSSGWWESN